MRPSSSIVLMLLLSSSALSALDWRYVDVDFAFTWEYNGQIGDQPAGKQPSKIMFNPGASVFADLDGTPGGWYFRPGGWFSWGIEDVYDGVARPAGEELIDHMKVLGLMGDAHFGYLFSAGPVDIGVQGGPSLYLRFPLWTAQEGSAEPVEFWTAYYGALQFLTLGLSSWAAIPVSENLDFLAGIRFYLPLSNLWTPAPFAHGIKVSLTGSLRFTLTPPEAVPTTQ